MNRSQIERILKAAQNHGILRPRDLKKCVVARTYLQIAMQNGLINKIDRGLYVISKSEPTEHQSLIEACKQVPNGILCNLFLLPRFIILVRVV